MNTSKRVAAWLVALCGLVLLAGCATGPRITTEADPRADFSAYRTWAFYTPLAIESDGYETQTSALAKAAVRNEMERRRYTEGTMNVDLVDARQKRLVWEGVAVGRVANLRPEQRAQRVNSTIAEIFANYPHRAGARAATL